MKKLVKILSAAAVLLCGIMLTGCGPAETIKEIVTEGINDSYKQWYKYEGTAKIPLGESDDNEKVDEKHSLKDAEFFVYYDPDIGLTVAFQSTSEQDIEVVKGLFSTQVELVTGGTKKYSKDEFGKGKWAALWASGKFQKCSAPKIITEPEKCMVLTGEEANDFKIQWKKVLANYLLNWVES